MTRGDEATADHRRRQAELYGEPLGVLLDRVVKRLGLTRSRLAEVLGVSAPMISQLMSAQRIKVGNPLVLRRMQDLIALADDVAAGDVAPKAVERRLAEVRAATGAVTTGSGRQWPSGTEAVRLVQGLLRAIASADELLATAHALRDEHPELAEFLLVYGAGRTDEAVAHFRAREHLL